MSEINQQAIADRLNLSRATVSRCFTNHPGISAVTRAKVFQTAAEIGYTHLESRSPKARKDKKGHNFTVLICSEADEYFRGGYESPGEQILAGVSEFAQNNDTRVDVHLISPNATGLDDPTFKDVVGLKDRKDRGILLIYPFPDGVIDELSGRFPLVSLVDQMQHEEIDCVDVDHHSGISAAIDHLVALGHRRIGFYTRDYPVDATWSYRRYAAFTEKMARLKLEVSTADVIGIFPNAYSDVPQGIAEAAERTRSGITAWVCAADHQAYDLIDSFQAEGLEVPRDVSVVGFDGIDHGKGKRVLDTLQIPYRAIGMNGAERLASRLRRRFGGKQHVYISGKLREGQTVASPKKSA